ncbi:RNA-directed DNA polymerase from mobile element jockey [Willisornis vidua]|uniref:RNA-directed DNA polymerase from mobile element jockey n=1 Tax=Willisornis vidua TaxID=1566151 RepID=A0ABQ9D9K8_9PASS|nr:RNA-directed DNA polymerase from mobile element jockey [Willisornis vidua]
MSDNNLIPTNLQGLKELANVITKPLSMIFEQSWESREVSVDRKLVNVVLIFKKGKECIGNYRPVSLTSVPRNFRENIIPGAIEKHLEDNTVISHSQYSFTRSPANQN